MVIGAFSLPLLRPPPPPPMQVARSITAPLPTPMQVARSIAPTPMQVARAIPSLSVAPPRPVAAPLTAAAAMALQTVGLPPRPQLLPGGGGEQPAPPVPLSPAVSAPVAVGTGTVSRVVASAGDVIPGPVVITADHPSVSDPAQVTPVASVDPSAFGGGAASSSPMMATAPASATSPDASTSHGAAWALPAAIAGGAGLLAIGAYFLFRR